MRYAVLMNDLQEKKAELRTRMIARRDAIAPAVRARKSLEICAQLEEATCAWLSQAPRIGARGMPRVLEPCQQPLPQSAAKPKAERRRNAACQRLQGLQPRRREPIESSNRPLIALYWAMRSEVDLGTFARTAHARAWDVCYPAMVATTTADLAADPQVRPGSHMEFFSLPGAAASNTNALGFPERPLRVHTASQLADAGLRPVRPECLDVVAVPLVAFDEQGARLGYGGGNYDRFLGQIRPDALVCGVAFEEQRAKTIPRDAHDCLLPRIICA